MSWWDLEADALRLAKAGNHPARQFESADGVGAKTLALVRRQSRPWSAVLHRAKAKASEELRSTETNAASRRSESFSIKLEMSYEQLPA